MKTVSDYEQFKSMHLPIEMDIEIGGGGKRLEGMESGIEKFINLWENPAPPDAEIDRIISDGFWEIYENF